jgi:hypothetical protein
VNAKAARKPGRPSDFLPGFVDQAAKLCRLSHQLKCGLAFQQFIEFVITRGDFISQYAANPVLSKIR